MTVCPRIDRWPVAAIAAIACGCGAESAPQVDSIHGRVLVAEQPLPPNSQLWFTAEEGASSFIAVVGEAGAFRYERPSIAGISPGEYVVTVQPPPPPTITVNGVDETDPNAPDQSGLVPSRYRTAEESPLRATLVAGENEVSFEL